ncbi:MAG: MFS transporter [Acidobacteria bacterium]|nr:MFS transporter [Acidobacteriota bacterium]MCG3191545.1 Multidrug resistance protein MdtH [Thermoanaerobaculia bacterium]MCK6684922.1 MFS transporter [Thermoanaerobaculia bacterium]
MSQQEKRGLLSSFPRVFWVANVMELFERAAYYGMNSVLAVYLTNSVEKGGLGFTENSVGFLQSLVYACTYVIPILGGALADRYGYRRMLLFAFSLMTAGYFLSGQVSAYGIVFASLLLLAVGAGLFKPIISGTIARTTTEENSGFGFGVYYWMINLGAFLAPLVVSYLKGFKWSYVFTASAVYCALQLLPALFLFKDPPKPPNSKSLKDVLAGAALVLGDARFMLMIVIYSGFWILYFQNFGSVLWYLRDFIDPAPLNDFFANVLRIPLKFDSEHVTVVNAGTIILLQVFVSRIVKNWKALPTMVTGIAIGALGFLCLAASKSIWVFVLGIAVFSIGEMTAHPKYYSYVGLVAPKDKTAVYMGYAFLYGVVGSLVGSSFGGALYDAWLKPIVGKQGIDATLRSFWLVFVVLDVVALLGLLAYNHFFSTDTPESNARARQLMIVGYALILIAGCFFLYRGAFAGSEIVYRTVVQAVIMLGLGGGGLAISFRKPAAGPA